VNAQPNASPESWTFTLGNLRNRHEMAPLFRIREASLLIHHFDLLIDYSSRLRSAIPSFPRVAGQVHLLRRRSNHDRVIYAANTVFRLRR
jgi:hypothetical protein